MSSLSDAIVVMVSQSISWATMRSFPHEQRNKSILKSLMVWPHWHCERCAIVRRVILRWIWNVVRKWTKEKQNERVLGWINNQTPTTGPTHEWKRVRITSKGTSIKSKVNSCLCNCSIKKNAFGDKIALLDSRKAKHVIEWRHVTLQKYPIVQPRKDKYQSLHVPLH